MSNLDLTNEEKRVIIEALSFYKESNIVFARDMSHLFKDEPNGQTKENLRELYKTVISDVLLINFILERLSQNGSKIDA